MGSDSDERAPMAEPTTTDHRQPSDGATFLLAIWVPGADHEQDPDVTADEFVHMLNQQRMRAAGIDHFEPVEVSAIPAPQWVTPETMARLRGVSDVLARVFGAETWDEIKAIQREHADD